jgi:hypothetical protein
MLPFAALDRCFTRVGRCSKRLGLSVICIDARHAKPLPGREQWARQGLSRTA